MHDLSTYAAAKQSKADIDAMVKRTSDELGAVPGLGSGPMGLTPDSVKASPQYRAAKSVFNYWQARQRQFNQAFLRRYKREYQAERKERLSA